MIFKYGPSKHEIREAIFGALKDLHYWQKEPIIKYRSYSQEMIIERPIRVVKLTGPVVGTYTSDSVNDLPTECATKIVTEMSKLIVPILIQDKDFFDRKTGTYLYTEQKRKNGATGMVSDYILKRHDAENLSEKELQKYKRGMND